MIQLFMILIATACVAGVAVLIEGATGVWSWLRAYTHARWLRLTREASTDEGGTSEDNSSTNQE